MVKYQQTSFSCGAAAIINAVRCLGKKIPERTARAIAGTTPEDGTSPEGIVQGLETLGLQGEIFEKWSAQEALSELIKTTPAIICTQNAQHWVVVIGTIDKDKRFIVIDSSRTQKNMKENGIHVLTERELRKVWQTKGDKYFGIIVKRKK